MFIFFGTVSSELLRLRILGVPGDLGGCIVRTAKDAKSAKKELRVVLRRSVIRGTLNGHLILARGRKGGCMNPVKK